MSEWSEVYGVLWGYVRSTAWKSSSSLFTKHLGFGAPKKQTITAPLSSWQKKIFWISPISQAKWRDDIKEHKIKIDIAMIMSEGKTIQHRLHILPLLLFTITCTLFRSKLRKQEEEKEEDSNSSNCNSNCDFSIGNSISYDEVIRLRKEYYCQSVSVSYSNSGPLMIMGVSCWLSYLLWKITNLCVVSFWSAFHLYLVLFYCNILHFNTSCKIPVGLQIAFNWSQWKKIPRYTEQRCTRGASKQACYQCGR